ncbi:MAG: purine permease [Treponema sp.]|nr:purine permease [Treponema sp.]
MKTENKNVSVSMENIYQLDGRVPLAKAIPFGLQHVLAMFVSNVVPIIIVAGIGNLDVSIKTILIQNCMIVAGIGTLVQLYPVWRVGSGVPIVMGVSFTFVAIDGYICSKYGYGGVMGAVIIGGLFEGVLGLLAKYWRKWISPIVSSCVVTAIGFSLLTVGASSFGGGVGAADFGSAQNLILGSVTLVTLLVVMVFAKGYIKRLAVLFGLIVGYIVALCMGKVNFSAFQDIAIISVPHLLPIKPIFNLNAIIAVALVYLVSATETIGDTTACCDMGLGRAPTDKEISGSLACDGLCSSVSGIFGCMSITSFSQNVGLVAMTKVVNRFTIATGAVAMIVAGLFPPVGAFFCTLPDAVLGGCTVIMFGQIIVSGMDMIKKCGLTERNMLIIALSLSLGLGFTMVPGMFSVFPKLVGEELQNNCVAVVFIISLILDLLLPKDKEGAPAL